MFKVPNFAAYGRVFFFQKVTLLLATNFDQVIDCSILLHVSPAWRDGCTVVCATVEMGSEEVRASPAATRFAKMEITNPEVMRVTHAHRAFQRFASALRPGTKDDFYDKSFVGQKISSFWSHSWHGDYRLKVLTLLILHNGRASILICCFTALTTMMLFSLDVLPGWVRNPDQEHVLYSTWAVGGGFISTAMTFLFWRSQRFVFLDRICINQQDDVLKKESIYSLGGIIRQSQEMLVLWDSTWSDRLWCQFEFAAFLSKRSDKQALAIRPTFLGPCSCVLFVGITILIMPIITMPVGDAHVSFSGFIGMIPVGLIAGYFIVAALRGYFRMVEALKEKMRSFSFDNSKSACCDIDHVFDGHPIMCDRQIVKECVSIWFGSQEAFEDYVRSKVIENVATQLETRVFTRSWSLSVTIPFMWAACDESATWLRIGDYEHAISRFVVGFVTWFLFGPILIDSFLFLAKTFSRKPTSIVCEILKNLTVLLLAMIFFGASMGSALMWAFFPWGGEMQRLAFFVAFWSLLAIGHLVMKRHVSLKNALNSGIRVNNTV